MNVARPTNNPETRGYSASHRAYDFAGLNLPDDVRAGQDGTVVERVNLYDTNWINNGTLTTKDYGNYVKVKHDDGSFELHAHLKKDSSLPVGTTVTAGQIIARIGNTGNSTGPHLHSEYRSAGNVNEPANFINLPQPPMDRRPYWFDRMSTVTFKKPHEQVTDNEVESFVTAYPTQLKRSGMWDQLCIKAGFTGDSNAVTVDQLFEKIKGMGGNTAQLKEKIINFVKTV